MSKSKNERGGMSRVSAKNHLGFASLISAAAIAAACQSVLGVEDLKSGPPPGDGGEDATGGTSGGKGGAGGSTGGKGGSSGASTGGKGGTGGSGGDTGGSGGDTGGSGGSTGGSGGDAGEGTGGDTGGTGGTTGGTGGGAGTGGNGGSAGTGNDPTVRGRVINHLGHPVPNQPVMIGDEITATDDDGEFEIEDVADTYDVGIVLSYMHYGFNARYAWAFLNLTRRDPTLQVYAGVTLRSASHFFNPTEPPTSSSSAVGVALGGEYGNYQRDSAGAVHTSVSFFGPSTVTMTGHALVWDETSSLPTAYRAYATSGLVALMDGGTETEWGLSLADSAVTSGAISGSVTSSETDDRTNSVFVQFSSGALIHVIEHYGSSVTPAFSYTVPTVPNAAVTLAAIQGTASFGPQMVAHRVVSAGQSSLALEIPDPAVPLAPVGGIVLAEDTTFQWNAGDPGIHVWRALSSGYYEGLFVVTDGDEIQIPTFANGYALPGYADDEYVWRVETHGTATTMEEATGPNGFMDSFAYSDGSSPWGPRREDGTYSISAGEWFTVTPP